MTLTFDLLTSKSIGQILDSWGVCMWSFMMIGVKGKQLCTWNHFQSFMHCDLDLWPFDLKIYRAHPWLMGSLHVKCHDDRCKGKAVMRRKPKCAGQTDGQTEGRTDRQTDMVIPVYPPTFVAGGYNNQYFCNCLLTLGCCTPVLCIPKCPFKLSIGCNFTLAQMTIKIIPYTNKSVYSFPVWEQVE